VLAEYLPEKHDFYTTYRWNREGIPQTPGPIAPASDYLPWVSAKGASGDIVVAPHVTALPKEAEHDRNFMLQFGMKSILGVPLIIGNRLIAGIAFEDFQTERQLTPSLLGRLKLVSEIFANALERKRSAIESAKIRDEAYNKKRPTAGLGFEYRCRGVDRRSWTEVISQINYSDTWISDYRVDARGRHDATGRSLYKTLNRESSQKAISFEQAQVLSDS
jgi:hypothetical protein